MNSNHFTLVGLLGYIGDERLTMGIMIDHFEDPVINHTGFNAKEGVFFRESMKLNISTGAGFLPSTCVPLLYLEDHPT